MMYQSAHSQRQGRAKGLKVKHLVQLVVLTVLFTWFLYQLNMSHKAKFLSVRAENENDVRDELLISDDKRESDGVGVDREEITAMEEFIDKASVSKSRKMLPDLSDTSELEQHMAEADRVETMAEDVLDDSGEGDRDERGVESDRVRRTDQMVLETKGGEKGSVSERGHKSLAAKRSTETAEDRGGEDEFQVEIRTGEEFDGGEGWTAVRNCTETEDDDALIYFSGDDSKVQGIDISEVMGTTNSIATNTDRKEILDNAEQAESKLSVSSLPVLRTPEDWKKSFTKQHDGAKLDLDVDNETKSRSGATSGSSKETLASMHLRNENGVMNTAPSNAQSA